LDIGASVADNVSIVIPSYNCGRYIGETLDSVLRQTRAPQDIVVIDDGSTDDTAAVVQARGPAVRYLKQANSGVAHARNQGLAQVRGDWIMFLDADDRLEPDALERLVTAGAGRPIVVYGDKHTIADDGSFLAAVENRDCTGPPPAAARACFGGAAFEPGAAIVPRQLALDLGGFDQRYAPNEDRHFWVRCGALVEFVHVPAVVFHYRIRPGSQSSHRARQVSGSVRVRIALLEWFKERGVAPFDEPPTAEAILADDLEAAYWTREWDVVDALLRLADELGLDTPRIRTVRFRQRLPRWLIDLKDRRDRART
jgi:glycosyltransferase involved in cell wall biosynthesis